MGVDKMNFFLKTLKSGVSPANKIKNHIDSLNIPYCLHNTYSFDSFYHEDNILSLCYRLLREIAFVTGIKNYAMSNK